MRDESERCRIKAESGRVSMGGRETEDEFF